MADLDFLSVSISCDEESPYYQCEVTLKDAQDYVKFPRDTPFIIHLFNIDYHFIIDTRGLNRNIDDEGHYSETCSLSGLSPLVRYASPRATKITKTWETSVAASAIVEELIGSVTWNLIDWIIPAYRLAAENAAPLDVAQQVVQAVGGLIESQPDGSVTCRHRWPVSIVDFDTSIADATLSETNIFSAVESTTQDEKVNRVRIMDQDAGYQDRLEYVSNKFENGEDDPFNGILYVFPSPWRSGLRIVTTRPSVIVLGTLSEGTRIIADSNEDYPAEILTFTERESSTQYPVMSLTAFEWLDEDLGSIVVAPYATTLEAGNGTYGGYSLAKVSYVARYLSIPVSCLEQTEDIEAQFLLLETLNG